MVNRLMIIEERLRNYGRKNRIEPEEVKIKQVIARAGQSFYESVEQRKTTTFEFFYQQTAYIRKKWWILQFVLLFSVGCYIHVVENVYAVQRLMSVSAALFIILIIPELWKNRSSGSLEIEGAAYFSLRQIYAARMFLFATVDSVFLVFFAGIVSMTGMVSIWEVAQHFFLPMVCTCCICFRALYSRRIASEYAACFLALLWAVVWSFLIVEDNVYLKLSVPVWIGIFCVSILYLTYVVRKIMTDLENCL